MGNWHRVHIVGTCDALDLPALTRALQVDPDYTNFHCLMNGGMAGLPMWAKQKIDSVGNLAERDYTAADVAKTLEEMAVCAPSLAVVVDFGGDYESDDCVATITLSRGHAIIGSPDAKSIPDVPREQRERNLRWQMSGRIGTAP